MGKITIPARHGIAVPLPAGKTVKVTNTYGTQVVDTWAFTLFPSSPTEVSTQKSMQHTRASLCRVLIERGDGLYDNERRKILEVVEDFRESGEGGIHDTLIAACDKQRYEELGGKSDHRNCADNLVEALTALGIKPPQFTPSPLNLFMNIPIHPDLQTLSFEPPTSKAGDYVCLRAEVDLVVAFSICPQDILSINCGNPTDAHLEIL